MTKVKNVALAMVSVAALGVPSLGMAQSKSADSGWYIGGHVGTADVDVTNDDDLAFKILGGYQINRNFAAEVAYIDFGKTSSGGTDVKANAWEAVGVGILPIGDRFGLYGKAGFFWGETTAGSTSNDSVELTYAVGVHFDLTKNLRLRGEWQKYTDVGDGTTDIDVMSVGAVFRF